jgi:predicted small secreted protein
MKRLSSGVLAVLLLISFSGCNTMKGAGQDVENTGHNMKRTVDKND